MPSGQPPSSTAATKLLIRPAHHDDLQVAAEIYAVNEMAMRRRMHPLTRLAETDEEAQAADALADLQRLHTEDSRQVWIGEMAGEIIGFTAAAFREHHAHIQYLYVAPNSQEKGVSRELLQRLCDAGAAAGCTHFTLQISDDPRALTRYLRFGFVPQPPNVVWRAENPIFPNLNFTSPFGSIPLRMHDDAALNTIGDIDKAVRGVRRRRDIERWLGEGATGSLLVKHQNGKPAGYFMVTIDDHECRIGPVAAINEAEFGNVLSQALFAAATKDEQVTTWTIALPGENQVAINPLLAAQFRPAYTMPFFATKSIGRFDRYAFHDLDVL